MANGPDIVNGHHHDASGDKSYVDVKDQSPDQPLEVKKGSTMTNGSASYRDNYSKTRPMRSGSSLSRTLKYFTY